MDIPMMLKGVTWVAMPENQPQDAHDGPGIPWVTHEGVFEMMGQKMKCFRLSNGQAVFEKEDFERFCEVVLGIGDDTHDAAPSVSKEEK